MSKFRQMPQSFRAEKSQEEWIPDAMTILCMETAKYKPKPGYCYNDYMICFILPRRLTGIQRSMFRQNPPVDEELRQIVAGMKYGIKRMPSAREIADFTGVSEERARKYLDVGVGARVLVREGEIKNPDEWSETEDYGPSTSPLELYLKKEFRRIVLDCIRKLKRTERYILVRQYFSEVPLAKIAEELREEYEAVRSRSRRAFKSVKECVLSRYAVQIPEQGATNE